MARGTEVRRKERVISLSGAQGSVDPSQDKVEKA